MENYNKYIESLEIECCNKKTTKSKSSNNCCGGESLPSYNNELEVLVRQLKREVKKLIQTTEAQLLCQNKKIDETMIYIKNNLSNAIRNLLDAMIESGQLDDIIKEVIDESIELLEGQVKDLNDEMTNVKSQVSTLNSNIIKKIEFQEYEDSEINSKFQNIDISTEYANNSIIYITKLKNIEKLSCLPTNGNPTGNIQDNRIDIMSYAKAHNNYDVYMNSGMNGMQIFDGVLNETTRLDCPYYCGFTANNDMKFYNGLTTEVTYADLVSDGIVNLFSGFAPIISNHQLVDYSDIEALYGTNSIATAFVDSWEVKHPRQLIGQDDDNNFYIFSIMGRFNNSQGFNYPEMQSYFLAKGLKNVFSCDGGGSMQTVCNKEYVFYPSQELDTNVDRIVPTCIGFKLKEVE